MLVKRKFLLVGSPNTGKTTIFNALTGLHQRTANYAGVTVEKFIGEFEYQQSTIEVIDLPGIYSLYPDSVDEYLAVNEILTTDYDGLILVINADQLQKNLLLTLQLLDLKKPSILVLNMIDEAHKKKLNIQTEKLSELLQIDIITTNARTGSGIEQLKNKLIQLNSSKSVFYDLNAFQNIYNEYQIHPTYQNWLLYYLNHYKNNNALQKYVEKDLIYKTSIVNYIIPKILQKHNFFQDKKDILDKILTHKLYGVLFLIITLLIVFQLVFFLAELPMQWIEWSMSILSEKIQHQLPASQWSDLLINGVIPGITGVVMFIPQIALLFLMIGILEESGYMARISFLLDNIFSRFGLSGKSLIPLVSGIACAVPSILSARTITNTKEKLITIMVLPFMSCSARLPVYTLMIGLIFPENTYFGFLNLKGIALLGLYLLGLLMALLYAWLFHKIVSHQKNNFFFIELPSYKIPYWKNLLINVWNKVKIFITDAGKIILAVSIVLWYLSSHSFPSIEKSIENKYSYLKKHTINQDSLNRLYKTELLENSYAGKLGKIIEPVIQPLGYDWKIGIALVTSFAAREVFVGTMATLYAGTADEDVHTLSDKIRNVQYPDTHKKIFTTPVNVSLLIYYALAMQCVSTMVVVYRELKSFGWMLIQFLIMTGTAYIMAYLAYHILSI